jgi:hypothetical protein
MNVFIKKTLVFILPLVLLIIPPITILWGTGENFRKIEPVLNADARYLIGYAYNESNYQFVKWYKLNHDPKYKVIALGSSRILQFRNQMFDSSFYNAGFTITGIKDFKGFIECIPKSRYPDYLIINLDQWMFNQYYDDLKESVSEEKWSATFNRYPSFQILLDIYSDLFKGKYSLGVLKKDSEVVRIGLNAILNSKGFRNDGSFYYGDQIIKLLNNDPTVEDYLYRDTFENIRKGDKNFVFGSSINQNALIELERFLTFCQRNHIQVIAILPPFAEKVLELLNSSGNFRYMDGLYDSLKPVFDKYQFELFDYTSIASCNSSDNETFDGFHGSEITYMKMLIDILSRHSILNNVTNLSRLRKELNNPVNRYVVYEN